jgi:hypothetical protein
LASNAIPSGLPAISIRAVIENEPHDRAFPRQQNIIKRNPLYPRPMLDAHFNHIQPFSLNGVCERPILLLLSLFMRRQQFHEAVESGFYLTEVKAVRNS